MNFLQKVKAFFTAKDKQKHMGLALPMALIIAGLSFWSSHQVIIHPLACHVLTLGTFFLIMSEADQYLHNKALIAAGSPPDREISGWDVFAGFISVFGVTVAIEYYYNGFSLFTKLIQVSTAMQS